jgi:3-oxoacyl-[acyl-carrier protein] reductase
MNINLKNKTALITGGEGGIGKSICREFSKMGANIFITTTKKHLIHKKNYMYLDFNSKSSIENFLKKIKKIKKIDILINNAGINQVSSVNEINTDYLQKIYSVNLKGPILLTKEVSKIMKKRKSGKIINISSIFGIVGKSGRSLYSVTKFGLIGLTKSSALDLAKYNILVNSVSPGVINTGLTKKVLNRKQLKNIKSEIPLNKLGEASAVSYLVSFLCSDLNTYITGQNFVIDGGYTAK